MDRVSLGTNPPDLEATNRGKRAIVTDSLHKHYGKEGEIFTYLALPMMHGLTFDGPKQEWIPAEHLNIIDGTEPPQDTDR